MAHTSVIIFGATSIKEDEIRGKKILEVGAKNVNGTLRPIIEQWSPAEYIGIDIDEGDGVDQICRVEDIVKKFGNDTFDVVVSTELLEHVRDWRAAISNIKNVCKKGGIVLITTRSRGTIYHGFPHDYWRYEIDDMKNIFSDFTIEKLEKDQVIPGVFIRARKPLTFQEKELSEIELYSMVIGKRQKGVTNEEEDTFRKAFARRTFLKKLLYSPGRILLGGMKRIYPARK